MSKWLLSLLTLLTSLEQLGQTFGSAAELLRGTIAMRDVLRDQKWRFRFIECVAHVGLEVRERFQGTAQVAPDRRSARRQEGVQMFTRTLGISYSERVPPRNRTMIPHAVLLPKERRLRTAFESTFLHAHFWFGYPLLANGLQITAGELVGVIQQQLNRAKTKLLNVSQELQHTQEELGEKDAMIRHWQSQALELAAKTPDVAIPAAVTLGVAGGGYAAGAAQEFLDRKGAGKVGPIPTTAAIGLVGAVGAATQVEDPDIAIILTSVAGGFLAGPAFELGRSHMKDYFSAMEKVASAQKAA